MTRLTFETDQNTTHDVLLWAEECGNADRRARALAAPAAPPAASGARALQPLRSTPHAHSLCSTMTIAGSDHSSSSNRVVCISPPASHACHGVAATRRWTHGARAASGHGTVTIERSRHH